MAGMDMVIWRGAIGDSAYKPYREGVWGITGLELDEIGLGRHLRKSMLEPPRLPQALQSPVSSANLQLKLSKITYLAGGRKQVLSHSRMFQVNHSRRPQHSEHGNVRR